MDIRERVIKVCKDRNVSEDHIKIYLDNLSPDALMNGNFISDKQIEGEITFLELFWGFGDAVMDYLEWENKQI